MIEIKCLVLDPLDNNVYIVHDNKDAIIIDPASNSELIINECKNYNVKEILVTHHHFDHIGALNDLEKYYNIKHNEFKNTFNYEVINVPGHSKDSIAFYFKDINSIFSGDFIFNDGIGRMDFEDSNYLDMINSLKMISKFDKNLIIYPGHGEKTILKNEIDKWSNI